MMPFYAGSKTGRLYLKGLSRELYILWRFINNDIVDTVLITVIVFFSGWFYYRRPMHDLVPHLLCAFIYALLYIYTFCLSNQVTGVEEDRLNKPHRPLVTGLLTLKEAKWRMYIVNLIYLAYGWYCGLFWYTLGWIMVSLYMNMFGGSNHWVTKNLFAISIGTFLLFGSQWHFAVPAGAPGDWQVQKYFAIMSIWAGFALPLQDLRDEDGDRLKGRKTLPLALGMERARKWLCFHYLLILPVIYLLAMLVLVPLDKIFFSIYWLLILVAEVIWHWAIAYCVIFYTQTPLQAHKTYILYVLLFCAAIPVICMSKP